LIVFGRNIWQSDDTLGTIQALRRVIHEGAPVANTLTESGLQQPL
jgi:DhnA family fructose-bisphosphate aldolase class Ia